MGHEVQSQAGVSIADVYDVKGSQAPVERLDISEIKGVHEMGQTVFSERFSTTVRRLSAGAIGQSTAWDTVFSDLPAGVSRVLGIAVTSGGVNGRIARTNLMASDPAALREFPLFVWDTANDIETTVQMVDGGAPTGVGMLIPVNAYPLQLSIITGADQPQRVPNITFRGVTAAFGAGTVTPVAWIYLGFSAIGGISSRGLPFPSW